MKLYQRGFERESTHPKHKNYERNQGEFMHSGRRILVPTDIRGDFQEFFHRSVTKFRKLLVGSA